MRSNIEKQNKRTYPLDALQAALEGDYYLERNDVERGEDWEFLWGKMGSKLRLWERNLILAFAFDGTLP